MACQTLALTEEHYVLGLSSIPPGIGSGRRSAHDYCSFYKNAGYVAYCYLTRRAFQAVSALLIENSIRLNANVLYITDTTSNVMERRFTYMFMRYEADWFVLKTYLSMIDQTLIDDRFSKPVMYPL